jgi:serine/threonine-protein kinase CHEK1
MHCMLSGKQPYYLILIEYSIRKAIPRNAPGPVIAVKFINNEHALKTGRLSMKQIQAEISLHQVLKGHANIIEFLAAGNDPVWTWIAMELADGGDLFDKIEPDEGVSEDIAHFYFTQLISAVTWMHSKGVAHRDLKPENVLLSGEGNLKLGDFGLAALYTHKGVRRTCNTMCGSPPYVAPEIVSGRRRQGNVLEAGYHADIADIWSCGIVLFTLLAGNTPWEQPTDESEEFQDYVKSNGHPDDPYWVKLPKPTQSLLRGMLRVDPSSRFTLEQIRTHGWFTRYNRYLDSSGRAANQLALATKMLESLHINFDADPMSQTSQRNDAMDMDRPFQMASTQPETPIADTPFDWERPPRSGLQDLSASQPVRDHARMSNTQIPMEAFDRLLEDPALSQFSQTPAVPLSLTQKAQRFGDIIPSHSLARFYSPLQISFLTVLLEESLHNLGIAVPHFSRQSEDAAWLRVKTMDGRKQGLQGKIVVEKLNSEFSQVTFERVKGDPLEWRRLFKRSVVLCKDAILRPGE